MKMMKNEKKTASNARSKNVRQHTNAARVTTDGRTDGRREREELGEGSGGGSGAGRARAG
jgi:hypothetical protein